MDEYRLTLNAEVESIDIKLRILIMKVIAIKQQTNWLHSTRLVTEDTIKNWLRDLTWLTFQIQLWSKCQLSFLTHFVNITRLFTTAKQLNQVYIILFLEVGNMTHLISCLITLVFVGLFGLPLFEFTFQSVIHVIVVISINCWKENIQLFKK